MTGTCRVGPLLESMHSMAPALSSQAQQYSVLLLVLAGPPGDAADLAAALDVVAHLPLLVVAIGVGPADFSALQVGCPSRPCADSDLRS